MEETVKNGIIQNEIAQSESVSVDESAEEGIIGAEITEEEKDILFSVILVNKVLDFSPNSPAFKNIVEQSIGFDEHIQVIFIDETPYEDISEDWKTVIEEKPQNYDYIFVPDISLLGSKDLSEAIKGQFFIYDWDENQYLRNAFAEMMKFTDSHLEEANVFCMAENTDDVTKSKVSNPQDKNGVFALVKNPDLFRFDGGSVVFPKRILEFEEIKDINLSNYYFLTIYQISCALTMSVGICSKSVCKYTRDYAEYRYDAMVTQNLHESNSKDLYLMYHKKVLSILIERMNFCPRFFQRILVTDLAVRTAPKRKGTYLELDAEELSEVEGQIREILKYIEDEIILSTKIGFSENKANLLRLKYNSYPEVTNDNTNVYFHYGNAILQSMAEMQFSLDFLTIEDSMLTLEGQFLCVGLSDEDIEQLKICASINGVDGHEFECQKRAIGGKYSVGGSEAQKCVWFKTQIHLSALVADYDIEFYMQFRDIRVKKKVTTTSKFFPIELKLDKSYFYDNGWRAYFKSNKLKVSRTNEKDLKKAELDFCNQISKMGDAGKKAADIRKLYFLLKDLKTRPIWLCANRLTISGNNGGIFFEYVVNNHPEIDCYFVLDEKCEDYGLLKTKGFNVVAAGSKEHKLLYMLSDFSVASQFVQGIRNPFGDDFIYFRDFKSKEKFVYLQHGVIKDDMSWINQKRINNFYGHVVSAKAEYDSLYNGIDFNEKNLWLTGLARFDKLYHDEKKVICFSPTWRQWLMNPINADGTRTPNMKRFKKSSCYQFYQNIFNSEKLFENAEKFGYEIWFCDHPFMREYDEEIYTFDPRVKIVNDMSSDELNAQSDLMITDYSSAVFDFVYLRKPVLYFQFDKDMFFQNHTFVGEGYFDYERDGFGEVEYDIDSAINRIIEYMESGCELKDNYRERIDKFFEFSDTDNCKRIYEHIVCSDAYKLYPFNVTNKPFIKLVDINEVEKKMLKNKNNISLIDVLIQLDKDYEKVKTEIQTVTRTEVKIVEKPIEIDYLSYVPERFYKGDLGLRAILWCIKGWLSHRFKKEEKV